MGAINETTVFKQALTVAQDESIPWEALEHATILVTGSTGLIGSQLMRTLLMRREHSGSDTQFVLPVRNIAKAQSLFEGFAGIEYLPWSMGEPLHIDKPLTHVIHAACSTSSKAFSQQPVETAMDIVNGAHAVLECARNNGSAKTLLLSTMEIYGETSVSPITEADLGYLDPLVVRNSYPQAKLLMENLGAAYAAEYDLPVAVLRLAQTFGQGVASDDGRVFADFGRCVREGCDIVMFSDGSKRNSYLSVDDAVRAVLFTLIQGKSGEAYNGANAGTYCSIKEMAQMLLKEFGNSNQQVRFEVDEQRASTFRKGDDIRLDVSKLEALGWKPTEDLRDMYALMFATWDESH